ncbi:hypothetical protein CLV72_106184 [Allonocardiopsis opalescens]|uniref:Uncharacterized protein n=2 Tax=Allonocardiopsis opalescens TaxID=1144618 RepID=A0A2T0Q038_9ACTN|nr:hypothetical protein CLV72_106184 [Allonocardiopsis opalescens]
MVEATESLDLTPLTAFVERWWRVAWSSSTDAAGHRAMPATAERLQRGEHVPTRSWSELRSQLGA